MPKGGDVPTSPFSWRRRSWTQRPWIRGLSVLLIVLAAIAGPGIPAATAKTLTDKEVKQAQAAFRAADENRWKRAERIAKDIGDPLPAKIIRWLDMTRPGSSASFGEISAFIAKNPQWPDQELLRRRAEEAMGNSLSSEETIRWFKKLPPVSDDGRTQLAGAMLAAGHTEKARAMIRYLWINGNFGGKSKERVFYNRYRKILSAEDHTKRLDRLLWEGRYWPSRRMLWKVDKEYRLLAFARLQLRFRRGNVDTAIDKVPEKYKDDLGLAYERLRWRREKRKIESAVQLLDKLPDLETLPHPSKWWNERAILARTSLQRGFITQAYRVADGTGHKKGSKYAESEWLAGWIALRFLKDFKIAKMHFTRMFAHVNYPVSRARAAYWAARAAEAMSDKKEAAKWFQTAAKYPTAYYGQLALARLPKQHRQLSLPPEPQVDKKTIHAYAEHELVRAVRLLIQIGRKDHVRPFVMALYRMKNTPEWRAMTAALARIYDRPDIAIRVAKRSLREDGRILVESGYPQLIPPAPLRNGGAHTLEVPLVLAVIRQESAFNPEALSHAGARGLMQLMPGTASRLAKQMKLAYSRGRLTADPDYNLKLGQTYLLSMIEEFDGSYIMAVAAYNAGPSRVKRWIKENGDPRAKDVDVIDWIEMIPFNETRNYVQRVMENLQIYRHRLAKTPVQVELEKDLVR
ncbi:MAG: lytic transglycosylase domain-containing protein [Rhodospirillales bacterium]